MPLIVRCHCGKKLQVPSRRAGTQIRCPRCAETVEVPKKAQKAAESKVAGKPQPPPLPAKKSAVAEKPVKSPSPPPAHAKKPSKTPPVEPTAATPPETSASSTAPKAASGATRSTSPSRTGGPPPLPKPAVQASSPPPAPPPVSGAAAAASSVPDDDAAEETLGGVEHEPGKIWTVYQLAAMVAGLAALGAYPAVAEVVHYFRDLESTSLDNWVYLLFFFSGLQLVYAIYLFQLPDWSTVWVVMIVSATFSTLYATFMGVALMAGEGHALVQAMELGDLQRRGYLSLWCFLMTLTTATATYFLIRFGLGWHRAYQSVMLADEQ